MSLQVATTPLSEPHWWRKHTASQDSSVLCYVSLFRNRSSHCLSFCIRVAFVHWSLAYPNDRGSWWLYNSFFLSSALENSAACLLHVKIVLIVEDISQTSPFFTFKTNITSLSPISISHMIKILSSPLPYSPCPVFHCCLSPKVWDPEMNISLKRGLLKAVTMRLWHLDHIEFVD